VGDRRSSRRFGSCERRVRVAVDEHPVGPLGLDGRLDRRPHRRGVGRPQVEPVGRRPEPELLEEDGGHLVVPVLARVQDDLVEARISERDGHRPGLDELRPVPDHREDFHRAEATIPTPPGR
jgi:hypothetical protein